jgi:hypothetical protein
LALEHSGPPLGGPPSKTPLYLEYERRGRALEMQELERIRSQLEQIRQERRSPMDPKEIKEHQKRMEEIVNEKIERLRNARIGRQTALSYDVSKYHNSFHAMIEKQEREQREE